MVARVGIPGSRVRDLVDQSQIIEIGARAMWVTLELSLPILGASLIVGLLVSVFQAVTQLQEPTLTFIPKILAVVVVIVIAGPWMLNTMLDYTTDLFASIEAVGRAAGGP
jgi:flagellar biosynthesis protein FliQ